MKVHIDNTAFRTKPTGADIAGIKTRLASPESI